MHKRNPRSGRRARPRRTVINLVERVDGKRRHYYSVTVDDTPAYVMKLIHEQILPFVRVYHTNSFPPPKTPS